MKRLPNFLLMMLTTVLLATFSISCSESSSDSDPSTTPTQPQTPVSDGDWQVVPATGGTIEKGDITITFANGTFSGETKVAITEVSRGEALGVDEVSKFYQLTVPARVDKPFTVKIKCAEHGEGINVAAHMPTYQISEGEWTFSDIILPSEYEAGEYRANMPASCSENDVSSTISFSLGVARIEYWGQRSSGTRGTSGPSVNSKYDEPYTYGNFSWHFIFTDSQLKIWGDYIEENHIKIHSIIREAIKKIHDLGFKVTERDVAVDFKILPPKKYGTMNQNPWKNEKSTVTLSVDLLSILSNEDKLRSSAIHEFFHIFQADYDKYARSYTNLNDRQLMYEAGAVWIEQFMNEDGAFSKDFAEEHISWFVKGFNNIDEIHEHDGDIKKEKSQISFLAHASHGYGMSSLFQYLTKKCTKYDINDKKIVELYELWRDKKLLTKDCLEQWTSKKGYNIFQNYNDFFISLFSGKLIPGLDIHYFTLSEYSQKINNYNEKKELIFHCYDYGCDIRYFNYTLTGKEIEKKDLVISQEENDVNTFVFWKVGDYYELVDESPVFIGAPEVISGKELYKKYYEEAKGSRFQLYALTTPMRRTTSAKPYKVTSEFRDEKKKDPYFYPDNLTFSAEGGSQTVQIYDADGYKKFGYIISDDAKEWLSGKGLGSGKLQITVQPNTTGKERKSKIACFVFNEENPTEAQKVYLKDSIKVTQAANKEEEQQQESEYELVSGSVNMYYAVLWRWTKDFKAGDDGVTITPNGKGAKVVINQEGTDLTFTWHSTISFEIDDLSLNESNQARISHFRFELEKDVIPYQYYDFHIDSGHELTRMVSPAPKPSYIGGLWTYSKDDLSYYSKSTIHYDKWRKDYYSAYVEHTEESETSEVTDGSSISISLYIKKK